MILFKTAAARASSRGYRWEYVFQMVSMFECPRQLAVSGMLIPSFANNEA